MNADPPAPELLTLAAQIVSAHVSHNAVPPAALPTVIQSVYDTLSALALGVPAVAKPVPAVPVNKSVFPDYIVCLEDGKKMKMLKRHLMAAYSMTPEQYRQRWELPPTYPMTAPKYAAHRSAVAKEIGLGGSRNSPVADVPQREAELPVSPVQKVPEGVRGKSSVRNKRGARS
jgi:predicted transcriptional regulator